MHLQPLDAKIFVKNDYVRLLKEDVIVFVDKVLADKKKKDKLKGDHLELLELCRIVLGETISNYNFHVPHACSNSRWMSKIIYSIKMFLFRKQINLEKTEATNMKRMCMFAALIYVKNWSTCCVPSDAPYNDLELLKELHRYAMVDKTISQLAIDKFKEHLWYLGSELVVLSLFSDKVPNAVKKRMFERMKSMDNGRWTTRNWRLLDSSDITEKDLDDLVDDSSMTALRSLDIDIQFMFENETEHWSKLNGYKAAKRIVDSFSVVNDCAERTLKLMTDINESLTKSEPEMQRAIYVTEDNRKRVPTTKKTNLSAYKKLKFE